MKAIRIEAFGGPETLHLQDIPVPQPQRGEVLLKVHAASVNPVDYKIRAGTYPAIKEDKLPYVLGRDASGIIESVGPGETAFAVGEAVYAVPAIDRGCYAEFVVLKDKETARKPTSVDHIAAAAVPLAGLTAWQGLFRHGKLKAGQRVLIHGGSGGVGHFAVQFAKAKGAHVIATVSGERVEFARQLGADQVIDYKKQVFEDEVRDVDMVFDLIGGDTQDRSWAILRKGGILVSTLTQPPPEKAAALGVRGTRYTVQESGPELAEIAALIDGGQVTPRVSKTFSLSDAAAAQEYVERGHAEGKIVLTVI